MADYPDSPLRRKRIESLCTSLGITPEQLLHQHSDLLSRGLCVQARIMAREKTIDSNTEVPNEFSRECRKISELFKLADQHKRQVRR